MNNISDEVIEQNFVRIMQGIRHLNEEVDFLYARINKIQELRKQANEGK